MSYREESEDQRQQRIRDRALHTVKDCTRLNISVTGPTGRQIVRELNDSIGMDAYEVVNVRPKGDMADVEMYVPRELALMLKLRYGGQ